MATKEITITVDMFAELVRKAALFDMYADYIDKDRYTSDLQKAIFKKEVEGWNAQEE